MIFNNNQCEVENIIYVHELKEADKAISELLKGMQKYLSKAIIIINFANNYEYLWGISESFTMPIVIISNEDGKKLKANCGTCAELQARFITRSMRLAHQYQVTMPSGYSPEGKINTYVFF